METRLLLERWGRGDPSAVDELLRAHLPALQDQVRRRLGPALRQKDQTGDLVQDAVVEFLRYGPRVVVSDDEQFRALLFRIVENVIRDRSDWFAAKRRSLARERPLATDSVLTLDPPQKSVATPSRLAHDAEREAWVRLGLELLDPEDRQLVVQRLWDEVPFEQLGAQIGVAADAARMRFNRAVTRLGEKVTALRSGAIADAARGKAADEDGRDRR